MMVTWELDHVVKLYPPLFLNTFGLSRSGCMEPPPFLMKLCWHCIAKKSERYGNEDQNWLYMLKHFLERGI